MRTRENIVWRVVGDDALVLLDLNTGRYYSLNRTAAAIWSEAVRGGALDHCADALCRKFDGVAADQARIAAANLLGDLQQRGLLDEGVPAETAGSPGPEISFSGPFQAPAIEEHEALQEVTAGSGKSGGGYSYSYSYTYYYYYYY